MEDYLDKSDLLGVACSCKFFRELQKGACSGIFETDLRLDSLLKRDTPPCFTLDWFKWVYMFPEREHDYSAPDDWEEHTELFTYDLELLACHQGSVEFLKWLETEPVGYDGQVGRFLEFMYGSTYGSYEHNEVAKRAARMGQTALLSYLAQQIATKRSKAVTLRY